MNKDELYSKLIEIVPVKSDNDDYVFRTEVRKKLRKYLDLLKKLDVKDRPSSWDEVFTRVTLLCDGINRAIDSEYAGIRHSAYSTIKNQLEGYTTQKRTVSGLIGEDNLFTVDAGTDFYRMRIVPTENRKRIKRKDIFHLPFNKKGEVKTQRYSVPGYPCLYLSHRVYGCWEEMGRPDFGTVMVSRFRSVSPFYVLDIRMPKIDDWQSNIVKCITMFPLTIASMVQVPKESDPYKPEYLIPQLLTEWIISHNRDIRDKTKEKEIIGLLYTSSQKNDDFDFPFDSYDNYAIPVLKPLAGGKYCKRLKELFEFTVPTYYDLEVLKNGEITDPGNYGIDSETEQKENNMKCSHFGILEGYLKDKELASLKE